MNRYLIILLVLLSACAKQEETFDLVIRNVNLIDGTGTELQEGVNIYIKGNQISAVNSNPITQEENVIDGTDKYVVPGLFDCHAHTANFKDDFPRFAHYGITSIFVPGGSTCTDAYYQGMRTMGAQDSIAAPRVFHTSQHFGMEGSHPAKTYANSPWKDGETIFFLRDTAQISSLVRQAAQKPILGIKLTIEDGPYPPLVERMPQEFVNHVNREARKNKLRVFVHISDNVELQMALDAGIRDIVHFTGVDLDFEKDKKLIEKIYDNDISWVTTLMLDKSMLYPKHPEWFEKDRLRAIYDQSEFEKVNDPDFIFRADEYVKYFKEFYGFENPDLQQVMQFQVNDIKTLYEQGVNMVVGTDTGNDFILPGYSVHEEMQLLELGGMLPMDIIKMATYNAAKMMDTSASLGSVEEGKLADLILLDKNPLDAIKNTLSIHTVIKNGKIQDRLSP